MTNVVGIGIDLTQHVPLVSACIFPSHVPVSENSNLDTIVEHWPPKVQLCNSVCKHVPSALLPLSRGEPLIVGKLRTRK